LAKKAKQPAPDHHYHRTAKSDAPPKSSIYYTFPSAAFVAPDNNEAAKQHNSPRDEQQSGKTKEAVEWLKKLFYDIKITDILLTLFTGLLAAYTYRLWKSTEKLWVAGEKQIILAEKSAEAAAAQVRLSTEALITTERAFVYCERVNAV
jgi:hypothetical protein